MDMKKGIIPIVLALVLCFTALPCQAKEIHNSTVTIDYIHTTEPRMSLSFSGNTANCLIHCSLNKANSTVRGTMVLYDITSKRNISSWNLSGTGSLNSKQTAVASKGHSYRLTFNGTVKTAKGLSEPISISQEKTFN